MNLFQKLQACIDGAIFIHETSDDDSSGLQAHAIEVWLKEIQKELTEKHHAINEIDACISRLESMRDSLQ